MAQQKPNDRSTKMIADPNSSYARTNTYSVRATKFYQKTVDGKEFVAICRYVECTGSSMQALVLFKKLYPEHRKKEIETFVAKATKYLEDTQYPNGGW